MKPVGKHVDYYEKYCSKCKHRDLGETDSPCKECVDKFFNDWKNPDRTFIYFEKECRISPQYKAGVR